MPQLDELTSAGNEFRNIDKDEPLAGAGFPPVTANVYFGAWAIKEALDQGADIVICPRVTDAAVVIGPAAWKFDWARDDYDALAGALAAGHVIECGGQACGGNYSFIEEVPSFINVGFPIAEIEADGSFTVTKHEGTGGLVSPGTVTAQLLYEISSPAYLNPDVVAHFDTLNIESVGDNRVRVSGTRGSSPPPTHKVCINTMGGYGNSCEILLTGLDIEKKAEIFTEALFASVGGQDKFDDVDIALVRSDKVNPDTNEEAFAALRIAVRSNDKVRVGRLFSAKVVELALSNIAGYAGRGGVSQGAPVIVYWPALIDSQNITERLHMNGKVTEVLPTQRLELPEIYYQQPSHEMAPEPTGSLQATEFGRLFGTRSGDKGGCANCGVWAKTDEAYAFLYNYLTVEQFKALLPDMAGYEIERFEMPNLRALNFYIRGVLRDGVSSNNRIDGQAKTLGEYLRAKHIEVPASLLG